MRSRPSSVFTLVALFSVVVGPQAHAWGERGHHTVCSVATRLITNTRQTAAFARFMLPKGHMMGHVCNLPDISWRNIETPTGADGQPLKNTIVDPRVGDEAHFINPESFGFKNDDGTPNTIAIPLSYREVEKIAAGHAHGKESAHQISGSNWWRTQQLFALAIEHGTNALRHIKELIPMEKPRNHDKAAVAAKKNEINQELRLMLISMGIMGHFVGDAGQPFHNSSDYNGKASGHYGIHSYYESKIVDQMGAQFPGEVFDSAKKDEKGLIKAILAVKDENPAYSGDAFNVVARMRQLSAQAGTQIKEIYAIEEGIPGFEKGELGKSKEPKGRPYADELATENPEQFAKYRELITAQMGVSAKLLATFWDEIYAELDKRAKAVAAELAQEQGGNARPQHIEITKYYTTWNYPLDTPYIAPSYLVENQANQSGPSVMALPEGVRPPPAERVKLNPVLGDADDDIHFHGQRAR